MTMTSDYDNDKKQDTKSVLKKFPLTAAALASLPYLANKRSVFISK